MGAWIGAHAGIRQMEEAREFLEHILFFLNDASPDGCEHRRVAHLGASWGRTAGGAASLIPSSAHPAKGVVVGVGERLGELVHLQHGGLVVGPGVPRSMVMVTS